MPLTRPLSNAINTSVISLGSSNTIDCSQGTYFSKTLTGNTILSLANVPTDRVYAFTLELSGNFSVTWWSNIQWPFGNMPVASTYTSGSLIMFITDDGGSVWRASYLYYV